MKEIRTIETVGVIVAGKEQYLTYNGSASFSRVVLKNETLGESVSATFMTVGIDVGDLEQKIQGVIDEKDENLKIVITLEADPTDLLLMISSLGSSFSIGYPKDEEAVKIVEKKIEGK